MKILFSTFILATAVTGFSQSEKPNEAAVPERPPVVTAPPAPTAATPPPTYEYEQRVVAAPAAAPLVAADQAQLIVDKFKVAYAKLGYPRLVIYVNRELVDQNSGLKLIARTEKVDSTTTTGEGNAIRVPKLPRVRIDIAAPSARKAAWPIDRLFVISNGSSAVLSVWPARDWQTSMWQHS